MLSRPPFQRAHQPQLEAVSTVLFQHADAAAKTRFVYTCRRYNTGKGDGQIFVVGKPPMPPIEFRDGGSVKECQEVKLGQRLCDFLVMSDDTLDSVDQLERAALAVLDGLRGLAPATVKDGVGGGNPGRWRRLGAAHDAHQHIE